MRAWGHLFLVILFATITIVPLASANDANATPTNAVKNEFTSANYWIKIDPIGDHAIGDVFFINGTTNLPVTENLTMFIGGVFRQAQKTSPPRDHREVVIRNIPIYSTATITNGVDLWSINVTDIVRENLIVDDYDVIVVSARDDITNLTSSSIESKEYGTFHLFPAKNETISTLFQTTIQSPSQIKPTLAQTMPPTTQSSPTPLVLPILIFTAIAILRRMR